MRPSKSRCAALAEMAAHKTHGTTCVRPSKSQGRSLFEGSCGSLVTRRERVRFSSTVVRLLVCGLLSQEGRALFESIVQLYTVVLIVVATVS